MDLKFESKKRVIDLSKEDEDSVLVRIKKANDKAKSDCVRLRFTNQWGRCISKTGYITLAVYENRLYFKEEDSVNGWKLSNYGTSINFANHITVNNENIVKWAREYGEGKYEIHHDKEVDLYYIEKKCLDFESKKK